MANPQDPKQVALDRSIARLEELSRAHIGLGKEMMEAAGGDLYGVDLLAVAAMNRSRAHIRGFIDLVRGHNILCAGALLRLQLDTAMRFSASWLVREPHRFAIDVLAGKRVRDLKDERGKRMTDRYLCQRLAEEYDWVPRVYERTSGYVHFSDVHMHAAISADPARGDPGGFHMKIADPTDDVPLELYIEAVDAFCASTEILLRYVYGWTFTKDNPEEVARLGELRDAGKMPTPRTPPEAP